MHFTSVILATLIVSLSVATPVQVNTTAPAKQDKQWTLSKVSRKRSHGGSTCNWRLHIRESLTLPQSNSTINSHHKKAHCAFQTVTFKHQDCRRMGFEHTPCSTTNDDYMISGGHDEHGFVVLVVEKKRENTRAFFGYTDEILDERDTIPPQTAPVEDYRLETS
ncbi:hypothetical protein NUW58_g6494 [Xylaria curta]|uniref:Uncharacterized protein n=1 Tax=Xylaria curta TaxID=42375 RepID=A0ACC1NUQ2_9PEZI|nr:hypothetical protein NUW58_g6494 [Xylaria curta]